MTEAYRTDRIFAVSADAPIPVIQTPASSVIVPGTDPVVPTSTLTPIVSYTNTADVLWLDGWSGSGQYDGDWYLEINSVPIHEGNALNVTQAGRSYPTPLKIAAGILVRIMVTHYGGATGKFDATLFGHRQ